MHIILLQQLAARHFADFDLTAAAHAVLAHTCSGTPRGGVRSLSVRLDAGSSGQAQGAAAVREQRIQASAIARAGGLVEPVHGDAGCRRRGSSAVLMLMMISHANGSGQRLCSSIWSSRSQMVQMSLMVQCFKASNLTCRKSCSVRTLRNHQNKF